MHRTHTCGELRLTHAGQRVILSGWVQRSRDLGGMTFIDLRDRYGLTQLVFNMEADADLCREARKLGREYVVKIHGTVAERSNKNPRIETGEIEIITDHLEILNSSRIPPFTIEDNTDGGEELRMKYRYLDLRRNPNRKNLELRHQMAMETRKYLSEQGFIEIETPFLIKSTPEGARDFVVPSRISKGQFYALPQSPQTFKQILMVAGYDRYFQLVKCFRDEDLRADRQPEFTQIDCEMAFVEQNDILVTFEGLAKYLFHTIKGTEMGDFTRMSFDEAIRYYGTDKPDMRFEMTFVELSDIAKGKGFRVIDEAELVVGICARGCSGYSRRQLDELTDFITRPQVGGKGLLSVKYGTDGLFRSSLDKFYTQDDFIQWADRFKAEPDDLILLMAGAAGATRRALGELRLEMGNRMGLRTHGIFKPLWVLDFPLLEWDDQTQRWYAMHHPFTSPRPEDIPLLNTDPGAVRANAYDLVINGVEIGGGSIRIHDKMLQKRMFSILGFTEEQAQEQFGFLMNAFEYGAPPHGGIAFGFDRWVALFAGVESIRDCIAFPKNNAARDVMIDTPAALSEEQLKELHIKLDL
jgi:aspartyl-tRNA synthetase